MRRITAMALLAAVLTGCSVAKGEPAAAPPTPMSRSRILHAHPPLGDPTPPPTPTPSGTPTAAPATFGRRVGALFSHSTRSDHFCTASVIDSPGHNMIITAAHCLHEGDGGDYLDDLVFAPGYRDGDTPYGVWKVRSALVDRRWADDSDPDLDVGFAVLDPLDGRNIADVVGSNALGVNEGFANVVRVTGYPMSSDVAVTCVNATTRQYRYQMRFACKGYPSGTSGSPWIAHYDPAARRGEVVGVIGGYHEGGNGDIVSYSAYFDDDVRRLYDEAVRQSVQ